MAYACPFSVAFAEPPDRLTLRPESWLGRAWHLTGAPGPLATFTLVKRGRFTARLEAPGLTLALQRPRRFGLRWRVVNEATGRQVAVARISFWGRLSAESDTGTWALRSRFGRGFRWVDHGGRPVFRIDVHAFSRRLDLVLESALPDDPEEALALLGLAWMGAALRRRAASGGAVAAGGG